MECDATAAPRLVMDVEAILSLWPSQAALARDIGEDPSVVRMWKYRQWIPPEYDFRIVTAGRKRGIIITLESIALIRESARPADTS